MLLYGDGVAPSEVVAEAKTDGAEYAKAALIRALGYVFVSCPAMTILFQARGGRLWTSFLVGDYWALMN